jgi:hypothetical protein
MPTWRLLLMSSSFGRREFLAVTAAAPLSFQLAYNNAPIPPQAALAQLSRSSNPPLWVRQGIVAASNMEALSFVRCRGGEETNYAEEWRADLCDATVRTLLSQGVNLIIVTLHKGAGLKTEAQDIAVAREFVGVAHRRGLRVGGYVGATVFYETLEAEEPESKDWKQIDELGHPVYYAPEQTFRYMACRNNPGYLAYIKKVLKVGVQDLRMDMIHFDQMMWRSAPASCHCTYCRKQFREFLKSRYPARLALQRFGFERVELLDIPPFGGDSLRFAEVSNPLMQEWALFRAWSLAERYKELTDYIRSLNPETAVQGNPTMNLDENVGFLYGVDYGQLLEGGDMIFSEEPNQPVVWTEDGRLVSQIRTYKGARSMGKSVWVWQVVTRDPENEYFPKWGEGAIERGLSEALAYNDRNLGVVAGWDVAANTIPEEAKPYIDLFYKRSKDLVNTKTVADVAVLRSYASTAFSPGRSNVSTMLFEQSLIEAKIPFAIIFDRHLHDLSAYKVLGLADQDALSDTQVASIRNFILAGGSVVAIGRTSLLNEWRLRRPKFALADVLGVDKPPADGEANTPRRRDVGLGRAVYIPRIEPAIEPPPRQLAYAFPNHYWHLPKNYEDLVASIQWAARYRLSAEVRAPRWVTIELARQERGPLLLHLVNYKPKEVINDIRAIICPPARFRVKEAVLVTPEHLAEQKLAFEPDQGGVSMVIPSMRVYALVTMSLEEV